MLNRIVLAALAATLVLAGHANAATVGLATVGTDVDDNPAGRAQVYDSQAIGSGSINRLSVYLDSTSTASSVKLALYDASGSSSTAGSLLGECTISSPTAGEWNRCSISSVSLTNGTHYWVSLLQPNGATGHLYYRRSVGDGWNFWSSSGTLTAHPSTWSNGTGWGAERVSLYADYASTCDYNATTSNYATTIANAADGSTVCLASGDYGTYTGSSHTGTVTVKEQSGATASFYWLNFNPASGLTFDGIDIGYIDLDDSSTERITIKNATVSGQTVIRADELSSAQVLFDGDTFCCFQAAGYEARVYLPGPATHSSSDPDVGVTIQNSTFGASSSAGNSDGVLTGAKGLQLLSNKFIGLHQIDDTSGVHVDAIQLYGSYGTVIKNNFMYNDGDCIMGSDGTDHEDIEDNVCVQDDDNTRAVTLESDSGSVFRHNTLVQRSSSGATSCAFSVHCGTMAMGNKTGQDAGSTAEFKDNILAEISVAEGSQSFTNEGYNVFTYFSYGGTGDSTGAPTYVGGTNPTTYAGFALTSTSAGHAAASDGLDAGARIPST